MRARRAVRIRRSTGVIKRHDAKMIVVIIGHQRVGC